MKLTLANIKELKRKSDSPLMRHVCNYVIDRWGDYDDKKYIFTDVLHYGCQSGVVGELIYYSDTVRFYKQYRQEINPHPYRERRTGLPRRVQPLYYAGSPAFQSRRAFGRLTLLRRRDMQSIIELLYKGDIRGVSLKLPADRRDKELAYYDKIKALMTGENAKLFDEYADTVALNYEFLIERAYALAFKTGFLLGLEMADTEEI